MVPPIRGLLLGSANEKEGERDDDADDVAVGVAAAVPERVGLRLLLEEAGQECVAGRGRCDATRDDGGPRSFGEMPPVEMLLAPTFGHCPGNGAPPWRGSN
jgi:hypothetical protein